VRVHDHQDVRGGREYLIEFPGLGDKRQFRWEKEAELLKTVGNDEALVTYDMLRNAERRVAFVQDRFNDAVEPEEEAAALEKRKPGRPKKSAPAAADPAPAASAAAPLAAAPSVAPAPRTPPLVAERRSLRERSKSRKAIEGDGGTDATGAPV
jgi:hypothetical protein